MSKRNQLGLLIPSRYYSSDFEIPSKEINISPEPTIACRTVMIQEAMGSSHSAIVQQKQSGNPRNGPNLLTIPLEIRLQIYHYVLLSHPIHHAHLAPLNSIPDLSGLNNEELHTTMVRANSPKTTEHITRTVVTKPSSSHPNSNYTTTPPTSIPQPRIQGKIPTALLLSCRQIFAETHHLPWQTNTFTFINWFWSGVYAARQFTRNLPSWQSSEMRHVSIEVLGRDLWVGGLERCTSPKSSTGGVGGREGKGVGEWRDLCGFWSGAWSLKLVVKGNLFVDRPTPRDFSAVTGAAIDPDLVGSKACILNKECEWVAHGLLALNSLRYLELEIEDGDVNREVKLTFCAELEGALNTEERKEKRSDRWIGNTRVVFSQRSKVVEKPVLTRGFVLYGGEPGDESSWGIDL